MSTYFWILASIQVALAQNGFCYKSNRPTVVKEPEVRVKEPAPVPIPVPDSKKLPISDAPDLSNDCLRAHNKYRAAKGIKGLKWSNRLANEALIWAKEMGRSGFRHDPKNKNGENLYGGNGKCSSAVEMWMSEPYYGGPVTGSNFGLVGHLTQVMWKNTNEVGCASHKSNVVCRYHPAGNFLGQNPY